MVQALCFIHTGGDPFCDVSAPLASDCWNSYFSFLFPFDYRFSLFAGKLPDRFCLLFLFHTSWHISLHYHLSVAVCDPGRFPYLLYSPASRKENKVLRNRFRALHRQHYLRVKRSKDSGGISPWKKAVFHRRRYHRLSHSMLSASRIRKIGIHTSPAVFFDVQTARCAHPGTGKLFPVRNKDGTDLVRDQFCFSYPLLCVCSVEPDRI